MGYVLKNELVHIQSYIPSTEVKKLDKMANKALRSRSDFIRLILAEAIKKN